MTERENGDERMVEEQSVGILIIRDGKVLTFRNKAGTGLGEGVWGLPGGKKRKLNPETDLKAAVRELKQETGYDAKPEDFIPFPGNYFEKDIPVNGHSKHMSWTVYICQDFTGEMITEETTEGIPEWVDIKRFQLFYETGPNVSQVIENGNKFINTEKA
jgi:8-oxo-dGTP pyrophosphatase MutT (NUDIX family)